MKLIATGVRLRATSIRMSNTSVKLTLKATLSSSFCDTSRCGQVAAEFAADHHVRDANRAVMMITTTCMKWKAANKRTITTRVKLRQRA